MDIPSHASRTPARRRRLAIAGWASLFTAIVAITWSATVVPAGGAADQTDMNAAVGTTLDELRQNSGAPEDPDALPEAAANLVVILNPGLAERERRKDPAFTQAEKAAAASFSNPGALHSKRMEDPGYRHNFEAAMAVFTEEANKAEPPVEPSATDAAQIEALRNDPAWRRQREEPLRALLPKP